MAQSGHQASTRPCPLMTRSGIVLSLAGKPRSFDGQLAV
jgi:hypothetical protein